MKLFAIVLAAGSSSRFGSNKQLQHYRGKPLVRHAVCLAEAVCGDRSVLVLGHQWRDVFPACRPLRGFFVTNGKYQSGIASSIVQGVGAVEHIADAALLLLADQPLVTADHLHALVAEWRQSQTDVVASSYAGTVGPPVVFPKRCFAEMLALQGDCGARSVIAGDSGNVRSITFEDAALDIDRPGDLDAIS
ncbi:MAG: nucleotidyltransferase family protein [Woeseia sp.]